MTAERHEAVRPNDMNGLSTNHGRSTNLGIQTSKADTHLYAWLPSSTEDLLAWRGRKAILLSSFLGIYRCAPVLSRRRNTRKVPSTHSGLFHS